MNCWEYNNCAEEVFKTCPAYPDNGSSCWKLYGVKCRGRKKEFSSLDEQVACCNRCDFYARGSARARLKLKTADSGIFRPSLQQAK